MTTKTLSYLLLLLCFTLSSCSEVVKTNKTDDAPTTAVDFIGSTEGSSTDSNKSSEEATIQYTEIEATWNSPCETGSVEYVQRHLVLNNGTFHQENQFHPDANCSIVTKSPVILSGTYEIGKNMINGDGLSVKEIDFIITSNGTTLRLPDIVYIQNLNTLYLGVENTTGTRPLLLDFNFAYTKQ